MLMFQTCIIVRIYHLSLVGSQKMVEWDLSFASQWRDLSHLAISKRASWLGFGNPASYSDNQGMIFGSLFAFVSSAHVRASSPCKCGCSREFQLSWLGYLRKKEDWNRHKLMEGPNWWPNVICSVGICACLSSRMWIQRVFK